MGSQWDNIISLGGVSGTNNRAGSPAVQSNGTNLNSVWGATPTTPAYMPGLSLERQSSKPAVISPNTTNLEVGENLYRELQVMNGGRINGTYSWDGVDSDGNPRTFTNPIDITADSHIEMFRNDPARYRSIVSDDVYQSTSRLASHRSISDRYNEANEAYRTARTRADEISRQMIEANGGYEQWLALSNEERSEIYNTSGINEADREVEALWQESENILAESEMNSYEFGQYGEGLRETFHNSVDTQPPQFTPQQMYDHFTGAIAENKNNPAALDSIVSSFLGQFSDSYDKDIMDNEDKFTGAIAPTNAEALQAFFQSEGVVDNAICGTIHGVVMNALNEAGIEAACVNVVQGEANAMHYTLIYKTDEGQYTFNNYGHSVNISAPNVLEAVKTMQKENIGTEAHSDGFVSLSNNDGSFKQYSLTDVAAFGEQVDPIGQVMRPGAPLQERGSYIATRGSTAEDLTLRAGLETINTNHGKINVDAEMRLTGESDIAHSGVSVGGNVETAHQWNPAENLSINVNTNSVLTVANLNQGNEDAGTAHNATLFTAANQTEAFAQGTLIDGPFGTLNMRSGVGLNTAAVFVPGTKDGETVLKGGNGLVTGQVFGGLSYEGTLGGAAITADAEVGAVARHTHTFTNSSLTELNFDPGVYAKTGASIITQNEQGFNFGFNNNFGFYQDSTQTQFSAGAGGNISYTSNNTTLDFFGNAQYDRQDLHHAFNETTNHSITGTAGLTAIQRTSSGGTVSATAGYTGQLDLTGYRAPQHGVFLGFGTSF